MREGVGGWSSKAVSRGPLSVRCFVQVKAVTYPAPRGNVFGGKLNQVAECGMMQCGMSRIFVF